MYYLNNFCSLCLARSEDITSFDSITSSAREILQYIIPNYLLQQSDIPKQICTICLSSLDNICIFRQKCVESMVTFTEFAQKLKEIHGPDKYRSVTVNNILLNTDIDNYNNVKEPELEEIKTEIETQDDNLLANYEGETTFKKLETVTIKVENSDDYYINEEFSDEDESMDENPNLFSSYMDTSLGQNDSQNDLKDVSKKVKTGNLDESSLPVPPEKSKKRYELAYNAFKFWCNSKNIAKIDENVMLTYFLQRSDNMKSPSSLWCEFSMLKSTIFINDNVDISKFQKLKSFVKKKNIGHRPKKSLLFTQEQIIKFITDAPDEIYLMKKVATIIGIAGAIRINELCHVRLNDVEDKGSIILVKVKNSDIRRNFAIVNDKSENFHCMNLFRKYLSLRPKDVESDRLFLKYQNGRCFKTVVGRNTFSKIAPEIASYLKLENAESYNGNSFRKTSFTLGYPLPNC